MTVITFEITYLLAAVSVLLCLFIAFCFGRYVEARNHKSVCNLPGHVTTLSMSEREPHRTSTRYVRIDKEDLHSTNDAIEQLEEDGYNVTDYDAEDGIITMEKYIARPEKPDVDVGQQQGDTYFSPTPAARGGSSSIIPIPIP